MLGLDGLIRLDQNISRRNLPDENQDDEAHTLCLWLEPCARLTSVHAPEEGPSNLLLFFNFHQIKP